MKSGISACACVSVLLGLLTGCNDDDDDIETFQNPTEIRSEGGELRTTLTVSEARIAIADQFVRTNVYNGTFIPPLLRVRPGDTIFLNLVNRMASPTNEHYHGMNVPTGINPDGTIADYIFVQADPGAELNYEIAVPQNHPQGMYWYHSHLHPMAEPQVMGGLSGGLIVDGVLDPFPELQGVKERILLLKDIQITPAGTLPDDIDPSGVTNRTVNGQTNPRIVIAEGETQFWRIANIGANMYYHLKLEGHVFYELARDGNRHNQLVTMDELLLPPASRSEVLIQGAPAGTYPLRALAFNTGPGGDSYDEAQIATLVSTGVAGNRVALPSVFPAVEDLRPLPVARRRTITFVNGPGENFFIDSGDGPKPFDPNRVDSTIEDGTIEEWTVQNTAPEMHVFHIHQTDFQVTEINGVPQPFIGRQDNVNVSFQADPNGPPGQVKVLVDFRNPIIVGRFVYHCHILNHEDGGMMAVAEVVPPGAGTASSGRKAAPAWIGLNARASSPVSDTLIANTLRGVQAGSFCRTEPQPTRLVTARNRGKPN
jgi:suppressor of ftsI